MTNLSVHSNELIVQSVTLHITDVISDIITYWNFLFQISTIYFFIMDRIGRPKQDSRMSKMRRMIMIRQAQGKRGFEDSIYGIQWNKLRFFQKGPTSNMSVPQKVVYYTKCDGKC